ncbi:tRNA lysidine(34) synthetase TilS [Eggerthella guodeyinii]|uniref:tRNA(Ile)-lysidine synthase n=1 Tax=Eggerthella guodeyinii TaxID=2690837 RepID=A0A6L7INC4_9ACTN|nr:tRNA lysidine(34) synthetase TilS [Eggerthella guodeyinii]QOS68105.1 tRNA lysidine(34) synthetase TilS [Eggerthella guodeyinii]
MAAARTDALVDRVGEVLAARALADADTPALLMVSGGSDSTALAYIACDLRERGMLGQLAMLHVNHQLRGADADDDARFVARLAELLSIPLFSCDIDIAGEARRTGENVEAVARRERYLAANEALESLCLHAAAPLADGRILTAHTSDDRVESFYMRSIVGTGPGGFRAMKYRNGPVVRPLLDASREELRAYVSEREQAGAPVACDGEGNLWREDATNAHTDRFRAYVRHEIVPRAKERNPQLLEVLCRTMNLIADEDDMLERMVDELMAGHVEALGDDYGAGCVLAPAFGAEPLPLRRRAVLRALQLMLGRDARVETASVEAVLAAFDEGADGKPRGGYVTNIQGDLAVSANKHGVRIEPMAAYRARRKRA